MAESKSKSESKSAEELKREPREPRALSSEYHKARKQLMLWSAILFIWELVGIDLDKAKEAGGNAGAIIGALKSPQAVPWALVILIIYFAFKLRVEWRQCHRNRTKIREAKQDYYSAYVVAGAAAALYLGQAISRVQLADYLVSFGFNILGLLTIIVILTLLGSGAVGLLNARFRSKTRIWVFLLQLLFFPLVLLTMRLTTRFALNSKFKIVILWTVMGFVLLFWPWIGCVSQRRGITRGTEARSDP